MPDAGSDKDPRQYLYIYVRKWTVLAGQIFVFLVRFFFPSLSQNIRKPDPAGVIQWINSSKYWGDTFTASHTLALHDTDFFETSDPVQQARGAIGSEADSLGSSMSYTASLVKTKIIAIDYESNSIVC